jgi:hypothetical protein
MGGEVFHHPEVSSYLQGCQIGIAIAPMGSGFHVGLLYRTDDDVRMLHLGWHRDLRDDQAVKGDLYLWAPVGLSDLEQLSLAGLAADVVRHVEPVDISYGIDWIYTTADHFREDGSIVVFPIGKGMTCATFIDAIFRHWGYFPVDASSWKIVDGDEDWQRQVACWLERTHPNEIEHIKGVLNDVGCLRLRPSQLAGSCAENSDAWSVDFEQAQKLSEEVLERIVVEKKSRVVGR